MGKYGAKMWNRGEMGEGNPGRDILTTGEEFVPTIRWGEGGGGTPAWTYLLQRRILCPLIWGVGPEWVGGMTGVRVHWKWRAGMSCKMPSQMWGSWYLPKFLFNEGSLILM